jgi:hypothetical protein
MESTFPTTPTAQAPGSVADPTESERLHRNLTPAIAEVEGDRAFFRYVIAALAALAVALSAVFMFNAIVDPLSLVGWRILPPAVETDRSIKLNLIDKLKANPQVVFLGSSRSRQAQPKLIDKLTGLKTGFNAGVTGGDAADAWVMVRNIAARFPRAWRTYIWFVDFKLASAGINPQLAQDPRSRGYIGNRSATFSLADVGTYLGFQATDASYRVVRDCLEGHCHGYVMYHADGSLRGAAQKHLSERTKSLSLAVDQKLADVNGQGRKLTFSSGQLSYFEKALAFMNAHGATPVIVLNPIYPSVYQRLKQRGSLRERDALAELHTLRKQKHYRFVVVDGSNIHLWGGLSKTRGWNNATHINRRNMRRFLVYIYHHSHGALKKP